MSVQSLKRSATQSARRRGHDMGKWELSDYWRNPVQTCKRCGMRVYVDPNPAPNGIDISGEAVALNCGSPSSFDRN